MLSDGFLTLGGSQRNRRRRRALGVLTVICLLALSLVEQVVLERSWQRQSMDFIQALSS